MSKLAAIEYNSGFGVCYVASQADVTAAKADEKKLALAECQKLGIPVQNPETVTAYTLYGLIKQDGRPATPIDAAPAEDAPIGEDIGGK